MFASVYAAVVGVAMIGQWAVSLIRDHVPERETTPLALGFHLAAEAGTALALLVAGLGALAGRGWGKPLLLVSFGMLAYTVVNSSGCFALRREWPMVAVFAVLLALTGVAVGLVLGS